MGQFGLASPPEAVYAVPASFGFGWSLGEGSMPAHRGKSGHPKAARLAKAGDARLQRRVDGKCHRKYTATVLRWSNRGKGEKVG